MVRYPLIMGRDCFSFIERLSKNQLLLRLMENVQMQGFRNSEEWSVHTSTPQWREMRVTQQMGVFRQPPRRGIGLLARMLGGRIWVNAQPHKQKKPPKHSSLSGRCFVYFPFSFLSGCWLHEPANVHRHYGEPAKPTVNADFVILT